jgi:two-component system NtrC family sensor kinase
MGMAWLGWIVAAIAAGAAVWFLHSLRGERARSHELLYEKIDLENALDEARETPQADDTEATYATLIAVADRLDAPLGSARAHLEEVEAQINDYRKRVREFDAAVQYCLQPVELILGADKATLDQLLSHVEGARRKLFEARTALQGSALHAAQVPLDGSRGEIDVLSDYARALRTPPPASAPATAGADEVHLDDHLALPG